MRPGPTGFPNQGCPNCHWVFSNMQSETLGTICHWKLCKSDLGIHRHDGEGQPQKILGNASEKLIYQKHIEGFLQFGGHVNVMTSFEKAKKHKTSLIIIPKSRYWWRFTLAQRRNLVDASLRFWSFEVMPWPKKPDHIFTWELARLMRFEARVIGHTISTWHSHVQIVN